ncbi:helix-turn-helix transcriptional regulator [Deinococcus sp. Leaf326]|jgi:DNA-binding transcriptional ArsR family regulator|uniref:ArsR/SmtB family transcription factor n=1 Tax=Deinococcus sp. Leaf326 TaxID=1736338 RepID=UPI0006F68876|nr:metalloregulator ArsR/SmtB family transcription factor [Deinococcus sp. Leaf326]KQR35134.1 ArsR family transcriptional regulator [Deinococcus sp. Leaf326]
MAAVCAEDTCETRCVHPQAVAAARAALPDETSVARATILLKLMGDAHRLKILSALTQGELCVCDLAAVIRLSESATSHQLRLLRTGRVVTSRKEGRAVYYRLLDQHVTTLIANALDHARE